MQEAKSLNRKLSADKFARVFLHIPSIDVITIEF